MSDFLSDLLANIKQIEKRVARLEIAEAKVRDIDGDLNITGMLNFRTQTELTIAAGVVTATKSWHTIDTEADAATDDLDTINGMAQGDFLILRANNTTRTVVLKDGTGNLYLAGDCTLDSNQDIVVLFSADGVSWYEVCRSNNGA